MVKNKIFIAATAFAVTHISIAGTMSDTLPDASYNLQGFYAGLGTGFTTLFDNDTYRNTLTSPAINSSAQTQSTDSGVLFDGHLGFGRFIKQDTYLGAKTSVYYTPLEHLTNNSTILQNNNVVTTINNSNQTTLKPIYNVNAVLGYEIYPHILPFVEGGVSFANVKSNQSQNNVRSNLNTLASSNYGLSLNSQNYKTGYNVGLGANYQMSKNWFLSSELIYNYLGKQSAANTITLPGDAGQQNSATNRTFQMISLLASVSYLLPVL